MTRQTLGHDLARTQFSLSDQHVDVTSVLGQVGRLLRCRVSSSDDGQGFVPEDGDGAITDGTGRDSGLPVGILAGQVQSFGRSTGSDDDGVGGLEIGVLLFTLPPVLEGSLREVDLGDGLGNDGGSESFGLSTELVHHLSSVDTVREPGEVVDVGGSGQLTARSLQE